MPKNPATKKKEKSSGAVQEFRFETPDSALRLLVNSRSGWVRAVDEKPGQAAAKRLYLQTIATREGIDKVVLIVEKHVVSQWTAVGFKREAIVPSFFKGTDGQLLGWLRGAAAMSAAADELDPDQAAADHLVSAVAPAAKTLVDDPSALELKVLDEKKALAEAKQAWSQGDAVGSFQHFGHGTKRFFLRAAHAASRGPGNVLLAEFDEKQGNAYMDVLREPTTAADTFATAVGLRALLEELKKRRMGILFAFVPVDATGLAKAYFAAGFRKAGFVPKLFGTGQGERIGALLMVKKISSKG